MTGGCLKWHRPAAITGRESVPPDQIAGAFWKGASGKRGLVRGPRTTIRRSNMDIEFWRYVVLGVLIGLVCFSLLIMPVGYKATGNMRSHRRR